MDNNLVRPPIRTRATPNITPFTYYDGLTYLEILEALRKWLTDELAPQFNGLAKYVDDQIAELIAVVDQAIADNKEWTERQISDLTAYVDNAVQQIINNSIEVQDPVVSSLVENSGSMTGASARELVRMMTNYYAVDSFEGDDDERVQAAVNTVKSNGGGTVVFDARIYNLTQPIIFDQMVSFTGAGSTDSGSTVQIGTIINYAGPAGTALFTWDDSAYFFLARNRFENMLIRGDGGAVNDFGVGATVDGLRYTGGPNGGSGLLSLKNFRAEQFNIAIYLDGYGHHLQECMARGNQVGYEFKHPEQAYVLNCWATYCDIGLLTNRNGGSGHTFYIQGGAFQRCRIGIWLMDVYEPRVDTYFEGGSAEYFMVLGDPDGTDYSMSVRRGKFDVMFSQQDLEYGNVILHRAEGNRIAFSQGGSGLVKPNVIVGAGSQLNEIEIVGSGSATPVEFGSSNARAQNVVKRRGRADGIAQNVTVTADHVIVNSDTLESVAELATVMVSGLYKFEAFLIISGPPTGNAKARVRGLRPADFESWSTSNSLRILDDVIPSAGSVDREVVTGGGPHTVQTNTANDPLAVMLTGYFRLTGAPQAVVVEAAMDTAVSSANMRVREGSSVVYTRMGD